MSQTLYRKYRSQRFAELLGQEMAVRVLRNSLQRGRISHAYLMCGPRGTGKTSVARIFAKALNCPNAVDGDCCGVCEVCEAIAQGAWVDVVEMDAASNRGIDDVKELRAKVQFAPLKSRYKVYVIDEVHQISRDGFNALLKTLEEPPGHVVFCLCTTDPNKLPVTILSRCIRLDFQRLPLNALAVHLGHIASQEGMRLDQDAALRLAALGDGSARDAISLLDQLTVYCNEQISLSDVNTLFQLDDSGLASQALDLLASGDFQQVASLLETLAERGLEYHRFLLDLSAEARQRFVQTGDPAWRQVIETLWAGLNLLREEAFPALLAQLVLVESQLAFAGKAAGSGRQAAAASHTRGPVAEAAGAPVRNADPQAEQRAGQTSGKLSSDLVSPPQEPALNGYLLAGDLWERYWREVHRIQMTLSPHLLRGVSARFEGEMLALTFGQDHQSDYSKVAQARNLAFLNAAARAVFGERASVKVQIAGGTVPRGAESHLDAVRTSTGAPYDPTAGIEAVPDGSDLAQSAPAAGVDGGRLEGTLERIERQIGSASQAHSTGAEEGVSAEDVIGLFGEELREEEVI